MFFLVDKAKGITSHDVINRLREITGEKRIGHAGTLDPNASGLLIVGIGRESTKELWIKYGKLDKSYEAEIRLGEEREGDDITGKVSRKKVRVSHNAKSERDDKTGLKSLPILSKLQIQKVIKSFVGEKMQIPPSYSAIKVKGKKSYEYALKGQEIKLKPRKVIFYSIKLLDYRYPKLKIECRVSSGTYIRSLARDIGRKLGCGAYLENLRRTKIGDLKVENAMDLNNLNQNSKIKNQNENLKN